MDSLSPFDPDTQECFEPRIVAADADRPREILQFDAAGWDDGDYDPPTSPAGVAVKPLPCRRPTAAEKADPRQFVYTLCVVQVLVDHDDPDDPDYIADGQAVLQFAYLEDAREAADDAAACPESLPLIRVPGVTHVVVNDWRGVERYRQRIGVRPAAA